MSEQEQKVLRAELTPKAIIARRNGLGRDLRGLLLQGQLQAASRRARAQRLPAWAEGLEAPQQRWLKKVWQRAQPRLPQRPPVA